jgi:hypothetical protein
MATHTHPSRRLLAATAQLTPSPCRMRSGSRCSATALTQRTILPALQRVHSSHRRSPQHHPLLHGVHSSHRWRRALCVCVCVCVAPSGLVMFEVCLLLIFVPSGSCLACVSASMFCFSQLVSTLILQVACCLTINCWVCAHVILDLFMMIVFL